MWTGTVILYSEGMKKLFGHNLKTLGNMIRKPRARHQDEGYRSFSTPAQIQAYAEARFDRIKWQNNDVQDSEVTEPGLKRVPVAFLDLGFEPEVVTPLYRPTMRPERRLNRIRDGV